MVTGKAHNGYPSAANKPTIVVKIIEKSVKVVRFSFIFPLVYFEYNKLEDF